MANKDLKKHISATYLAFRRGLAIIGFLLPVILYVGGRASGSKLPLQGSMSAYYHASNVGLNAENQNKDKHGTIISTPASGEMRNWFVGGLFAIGFILFLYQGFSKREDYALNAAGALALGVALFPTDWGGQFEGISGKIMNMNISLHGACAVGVFLCIAYVCIRRSGDTLDLIKDEIKRARYRKTYKILGWLMLLSPIIAFVLHSVLGYENSLTFFVEAVGIWIFASYWLVKSCEISVSSADTKAALGSFENTSIPNPRS